MNKDKEEIVEEEQVPHCPMCKAKCIRTKRMNKALEMEQEIWVCPDQKYPSCL